MLTFIVTAHKETYDAYQFISCLMLQTDSRWECIIMCDGRNDHVNMAVKLLGDDRFTVHEETIPSGFWGHKNRKKALYEYATGEFVLQTSIQDYYINTAVSQILSYKNDYDVLFYNCLHNHFDFNVLDTKMSVGDIDWGSFAVRLSVAKTIGLENLESLVCDGLFAESCTRVENIRIKKLDKILTVHS